jgi:hypothetical protein
MSNYGFLHLPMQSISVPKHNDARLIFTTVDEAGTLVDISGVSEIIFRVWDKNGGTLQFEKTLSDGDIVLHGDDNRFSLFLTNSETGAITSRLAYHECLMINSSGLQRTVSAGLFRAETTNIFEE